MPKTYPPRPENQDIVHIHNLRVWTKSKYPTKQIKREDIALFNKQKTKNIWKEKQKPENHKTGTH